jgi:hypothetical protein
MPNEISQLIANLQNGSMSLKEVAQRFREHSWIRTGIPEPQTYLEMAAAAQQDPEPLVAGSFEEVTAAYRRGDISRPDYRVLAQAAAEAMRQEGEHDAQSD